MFVYLLLFCIVCVVILVKKFEKPIDLEDFIEEKTVKNDDWNNIPDGDITLRYSTISNREIGYINYKIGVGEVSIFRVEKKCRGMGLGKQILTKVIDDMRKAGTKSIWAIAIENHDFWSNVFNKSFTYYPSNKLHSSVTEPGYRMEL